MCFFLRIVSSYGQNLENSTYRGETIFCILICIMGLVFFSHLIGNMQVYSLWLYFTRRFCLKILLLNAFLILV